MLRVVYTNLFYYYIKCHVMKQWFIITCLFWTILVLVVFRIIRNISCSNIHCRNLVKTPMRSLFNSKAAKYNLVSMLHLAINIIWRSTIFRLSQYFVNLYIIALRHTTTIEVSYLSKRKQMNFGIFKNFIPNIFYKGYYISVHYILYL